MIVHFVGFFFYISNFFLFFTQLSRKVVENINLAGGSFLGVSRGGGNISEIVDSIQVIIFLVAPIWILNVIRRFFHLLSTT